MRLDKFGSQLDRKSKTWIFIFLNVYPESNGKEQELPQLRKET